MLVGSVESARGAAVAASLAVEVARARGQATIANAEVSVESARAGAVAASLAVEVARAAGQATIANAEVQVESARAGAVRASLAVEAARENARLTLYGAELAVEMARAGTVNAGIVIQALKEAGQLEVQRASLAAREGSMEAKMHLAMAEIGLRLATDFGHKTIEFDSGGKIASAEASSLSTEQGVIIEALAARGAAQADGIASGANTGRTNISSTRLNRHTDLTLRITKG